MTKYSLAEANKLTEQGEYSRALEIYEKASTNHPKIETMLKSNIQYVKQKMSREKMNRRPNQIEKINFMGMEEKYYPETQEEVVNTIIKPIAFYLPQFHPFKENNEWWGKGFTEWKNVTKAKPNYAGHYQPHLPTDLGFYDLRVSETMVEQAKLAKKYGIHGFSYYYYWFAGKTLMETPLTMMLNNKDIDIPFCLTWANENWTRRWDGQENDVLMAQKHSMEDSKAFIWNLEKYFKDERYIKVNNKPLLIIYRASIIPEIEETAKMWRKEVKKMGFNGLHLVCAQTFGIKSPEPYGFDAAVEFPPHTVVSGDIKEDVHVKNPKYEGHIYDYNQVVQNAISNKETPYTLYRGVMLSWDNTARKQNNSHIFHNFSLEKYMQWLDHCCFNLAHNSNHNENEKFIFINAWNEWAEGTHLEPDQRYGHGYLTATAKVLNKYTKIWRNDSIPPAQTSDYAVILHAHYPESINEIAKYINNLKPCDIYITCTNIEAAEKCKSYFPQATLELVPNKGRDILPFIETLRKIHHLNYKAICKVHTKKSVYREDGEQLRKSALDSLLSPKSIKTVKELFNSSPSIGTITPRSIAVAHTSKNLHFNYANIVYAAQKMQIPFVLDNFPAGSMFWFKQHSLDRLLTLSTEDFAIEEGLVDGTMPHAIERLLTLVASGIGYKSIVID
jgi:lipopolysaccharide biosynthesis protein